MGHMRTYKTRGRNIEDGLVSLTKEEKEGQGCRATVPVHMLLRRHQQFKRRHQDQTRPDPPRLLKIGGWELLKRGPGN